MTVQMRDGYGIQAFDWNNQWRKLDGYGIITGGTVTVNTGTLGTGGSTLSLEATTALVNGTEHSVAGQTIDIRTGDTDPRWDIVAIDSTGAVTVNEGVPETAISGGDMGVTHRDAERPAPDDLADENITPLALVWVPDGAAEITSSDLFDVGVDSRIHVDQLVGAGGISATDYIVGEEQGADYNSIQAAIDAGDGLSLISVMSSYDSSRDTFPIVMSREIIRGVGGRGNVRVTVGDALTSAFEIRSTGAPGGTIQGLSIRNANRAIEIIGSPLSVVKDCNLYDCHRGIHATDDGVNDPFDLYVENVRIRANAAGWGDNSGIFGYIVHNSHFNHVTCVEHNVGCYIRDSNALSFTAFGPQLNRQEGVYLLQCNGVTFDSAYIEGNSTATTGGASGVRLSNCGAVTFNGCYFYGIGRPNAGITDGAGASTEVTVQNCAYRSYVNGFIDVTMAGSTDWDIHAASHTALGTTPLYANLNGGRLRSGGVIVGPNFSGVDFTTVTGERNGDIAISNGTGDYSQFDIGIWDATAATWHTTDARDLLDVQDGDSLKFSVGTVQPTAPASGYVVWYEL